MTLIWHLLTLAHDTNFHKRHASLRTHPSYHIPLFLGKRQTSFLVFATFLPRLLALCVRTNCGLHFGTAVRTPRGLSVYTECDYTLIWIKTIRVSRIKLRYVNFHWETAWYQCGNRTERRVVTVQRLYWCVAFRQRCCHDFVVSLQNLLYSILSHRLSSSAVEGSLPGISYG